MYFTQLSEHFGICKTKSEKCTGDGWFPGNSIQKHLQGHYQDGDRSDYSMIAKHGSISGYLDGCNNANHDTTL